MGLPRDRVRDHILTVSKVLPKPGAIPATTIPAPSQLERASYDARFAASVSEGLEDIAAGRIVSNADLGKLLDARYGALPRAKSKGR